MPEYLSPGVYVEEISTGPKPIEGVSTSTAGFVGPTERGPTAPRLVTSWLDYQRWFGSYLEPQRSYLPYSIQGFFQNGGQRAFVARVVGQGAQRASATLTAGESKLVLAANGPGSWGEGLLVRIEDGTRSRTRDDDGNDQASSLFRITILYYEDGIPEPFQDPTQPQNRSLRGFRAPDVFEDFDNLSAQPGSATYIEKVLNSGSRLITATFEGTPARPGNVPFPGDSTDSTPQFQFPDKPVDGGVGQAPPQIQQAIDVLTPLSESTTDTDLAAALGNASTLLTAARNALPENDARIQVLDAQIAQLIPNGDPPTQLDRRDAVVEALRPLTATPSDGNADDDGDESGSGTAGEGAAIGPEDFAGDGTAAPDQRTGLAGLAAIDEISLVVIPDQVNEGLLPDDAARNRVTNDLIDQCELLKDRFAVLSEAKGQGQVQNILPVRDTTYGAVYYPWIRVFDPRTQDTLLVPPAGHVTGIYARSDIERGVHKAPANEVVRGILTTDLSGNLGPLEYKITKGEHDILNPRGINVIRDFRSDRRGIRVWGARTLSSDGEWKYVNVRRLFLFIEESIEEGTQWVVFEPNHEPTWARVRRSVGDFLNRVWRDGALRGLTQEEAFFVRCDRTTMTEDDINNGRLICYIGIAPVKPAEFVIFRIGQKTLEATE